MKSNMTRTKVPWAWIWLSMLGVGFGAVFAGTPRIGTNRTDFYMYGTQSQNNTTVGGTFEPMLEAQYCAGCHQDFAGEQPNSYTIPFERWSYTMMSQAYRDPVFHAQFQISNQDAGSAGDLCMRCHAPMGWIENRAVPADGSGLAPLDTQGVNCISCHRQVNPVQQVGAYPPAGGPPGSFDGNTDRNILVSLGADRPPDFVNGGALAANGYVIDPKDRRRGPVDLVFMPYHNWLQSPFHETSGICASCHDVSNPIFTRVGDTTYVRNSLETKHPTGNKYDMFPLDRLYSEWSKSEFAGDGVTLTVPNPNGTPDLVGRFSFDGVTVVDPTTEIRVFNDGTLYATCQDCHQPNATGQACELSPPVRDDVPVHNFSGGNSWVLRAVADMFGTDSGMDQPGLIDQSVARNKSMLARAADMGLSVAASSLGVRVTNQVGHKLPGGFSEGRRMWINVKFYDAANALIAERGAYDNATAALNEGDTKVYKTYHGMDAAIALEAELPMGPSFHLDLNNVRLFDNRIPPRGFNNAAFASIQAEPVGYTYADGQYWDDTSYTIPSGATRAEVRLFMQTTSREYIEFLRDNATAVSGFVPQPSTVDPVTHVETVNWTLPPGFPAPTPPVNMPLGQLTYAQWIKQGRSEPVLMNYGSIDLAASAACNLADITGIGGPPSTPDGLLTGDDFNAFIAAFAADDLLADVTGVGGPPSAPDGLITGDDFIAYINAFSSGCP